MKKKNSSPFAQKKVNRTIFLPGNEPAYQVWRAQKLENFTTNFLTKRIKVRDLSQVANFEISDILAQCNMNNMALYELSSTDSASDQRGGGLLRLQLKSFCRSLGLVDAEMHRSQDDDGVVSIEMRNSGVGAGYIPYTDKPLSWHTDGYYNAPKNRINAMVLHCVRDAMEGGENELLDPEIAYLRLRDANVAYISALMHPQALEIPENTDPRSTYRPKSVGPVFFLDDINGALNMRYSARSRNIVWRDDPDTANARAVLTEILKNDPLIIRHKLKPGQGLISNNVLHNRTRFKNQEPSGDAAASRLLYRIRYKQRVSATH